MENYFQPEIECASREQIRAWQDERLVETVKHVYENVPYYRNLMEEKNVTPDDIKGVDDLHKLPFLTKDDLREAYPYGLLAEPLETVCASSLPVAPLDAGSLLFIPRMTLTCGMNAAPVPLWQPEEPRKT